MSREHITWAESCELMKTHGVVDSSEDMPSEYSEGYYELSNGWRLEFRIHLEGPYSEYTPDIDASLVMEIVK